MIVMFTLITFRVALYAIAVLVLAGPVPPALLPRPLSHLFDCYFWFEYHYLKKIYSPHFNKNENIRRYVELSTYLTKCIIRGTRFELTILLIPLVITVMEFLLSLMFLHPFSILAFVLFAYVTFVGLGIWFGAVDARVYVDTIVRRRSCYESSRLSKEVEDTISNLSLEHDYYKLFSDHKATIGFFTFTIVFLGFLWYGTMILERKVMVMVLGNNVTNMTGLVTFEEILRKFVWPSTPTNNRDVYELVREFLFMSVFHFFPFALTVRYYVFIIFTFFTLKHLGKYLKGLRSLNERFVNVKLLEQKLIEDVIWDVAIPLMSIFLRYIWTGKVLKELMLGGLNLHTLFYALMLVSLLDLPMAPVTYHIKFIVEAILQRLFRLIFHICSVLNLILLKIRQKLFGLPTRFYC